MVESASQMQRHWLLFRTRTLMMREKKMNSGMQVVVEELLHPHRTLALEFRIRARLLEGIITIIEKLMTMLLRF